MKRPVTVAVGIVTVMLLAIAAAGSVAAHMGVSQGGSAVSQSSGTTISMTDAAASFDQYLQRQGFDTLKISEIMRFSNQFYAEAVDSTTGAGALELVMSLDGKIVTPEPGPMMMWNTTYSPMVGSQGSGLRQEMPGYGMMSGSGHGMMGGSHGYGMMGGNGPWGNASTTPGSAVDPTSCAGSTAMGYHAETATQLDQPLTADEAQTRVQAWLDQNRPGVTATDATAFPGYFTVHTEQDGKITGMLSIQSSTGAIWEHVWHGDFVAMEPPV